MFRSVKRPRAQSRRGSGHGDWLLFIDADSHPSAELFADVVEQIKSGHCLAGGSTVRLEAGYRFGSFVTGFWNMLSRWKRWLAGSFIFCDAGTFRKIGGFSEELFAGEELDLSLRLQQLARESAKNVVILHRHPLITSARKFRLYSARELVRLFVRAIFNWNGTLRNREACHAWYDGRR